MPEVASVVPQATLGHPRCWPTPPPIVLPGDAPLTSTEPGSIWLFLLACLNFHRFQDQTMVSVRPLFFLPKSEDYYSIFSHSSKNRDSWRGFLAFVFSSLSLSTVFPMQPWVFSGLSALSTTLVSCTSLRDKIGSPSDCACYFLCPGFSVSCIFKSWSLQRERKQGDKMSLKAKQQGKRRLKWNISVLQSNSGISNFFVHHWKKNCTY